jgi:hypothetical protein
VCDALTQLWVEGAGDDSGVLYWNTLQQEGLSRTAVIDSFLNLRESRDLSEGGTGFTRIVTHNAWNNLDMVVSKGVAAGTGGDDQISNQEIKLDSYEVSHLVGKGGIDTFMSNDAASTYNDQRARCRHAIGQSTRWTAAHRAYSPARAAAIWSLKFVKNCP